MRRILAVALMSAGLLAATAAGSAANAWSERDHGGYSRGGGYSYRGGYGDRGYGDRGYGRPYYAPSYGYRYYAPPPPRWHHHHRPHYRPYGYYGW